MRICPHCGSELHDDSTFCFACMSIVNERKELLIKVNTSRKRTIPMVCIAVAIIAASSVFAVVSKKNNAVETKTPEPAKAVTTSATVTTIPQTTTAAKEGEGHADDQGARTGNYQEYQGAVEP